MADIPVLSRQIQDVFPTSLPPTLQTHKLLMTGEGSSFEGAFVIVYG